MLVVHRRLQWRLCLVSFGTRLALPRPFAFATDPVARLSSQKFPSQFVIKDKHHLLRLSLTLSLRTVYEDDSRHCQHLVQTTTLRLRQHGLRRERATAVRLHRSSVVASMWLTRSIGLDNGVSCAPLSRCAKIEYVSQELGLGSSVADSID
jgi:hypothetical protein